MGDKMVNVLFTSGVTYINYGTDEKHIKTRELSMSEAMLLALDIGCYFDWEDVTTSEIEDCIDTLEKNGFEIDRSKDEDGFTDQDFFRLWRNIDNGLIFKKHCTFWGGDYEL